MGASSRAATGTATPAAEPLTWDRASQSAAEPRKTRSASHSGALLRSWTAHRERSLSPWPTGSMAQPSVTHRQSTVAKTASPQALDAIICEHFTGVLAAHQPEARGSLVTFNARSTLVVSHGDKSRTACGRGALFDLGAACSTSDYPPSETDPPTPCGSEGPPPYELSVLWQGCQQRDQRRREP